LSGNCYHGTLASALLSKSQVNNKVERLEQVIKVLEYNTFYSKLNVL